MSDVNLKSYSDTSYHNEELKSLIRYRFDKVQQRAQLKQSCLQACYHPFPWIGKTRSHASYGFHIRLAFWTSFCQKDCLLPFDTPDEAVGKRLKRPLQSGEIAWNTECCQNLHRFQYPCQIFGIKAHTPVNQRTGLWNLRNRIWDQANHGSVFFSDPDYFRD